AVAGSAFLAIPAAGWSAVAAAMVPEQFTGTSRFSGMAIGYNVATVLFGGLSPLIATALMSSTGVSLAPAIYATAVIVIAGIPTLLLARSMGHKTLADVDEDPHLVTACARWARPVASDRCQRCRFWHTQRTSRAASARSLDS